MQCALAHFVIVGEQGVSDVDRSPPCVVGDASNEVYHGDIVIGVEAFFPAVKVVEAVE